jgi:hypothetical protein
MKTKIEELEERKRQIDIEIAYENGAKINRESKIKALQGLVSIHFNEPFNWAEFNYTITKEPQKIPFDGSDAFGLVGQKFKPKNDDSVFGICILADTSGVKIADISVAYSDLEMFWKKWNTLKKVWEECSKIK